MNYSFDNDLEAGPNDETSMGWWARLTGKSVINLYGSPYMIRYRFFNAPSWLGGWGLRLHHILRSDADRELHDHPFDFCSVILTYPGYVETTLNGAKFWPRGSIIKRKAEELHRLSLVAPVWTFVIRGRVRRAWGFRLATGQWVHWRDFAKIKGIEIDEDYVSSYETKVSLR